MNGTNGTQPPLPPIGFVAVDVHFTRVAGDAYSSHTWPFPLIREEAAGTAIPHLVTSQTYPTSFIDNFVAAAQKLIDRGAVGIMTSCGFLAMAQPEVAARLSVPVATSSLCQIPSIQAILPRDRSIGVITFDGAKLTPTHLTQLRVADVEKVFIVGPDDNGELKKLVRDGAKYNHGGIEEELVACAREIVRVHPDMGALVLECTQMAPFAEAIQKAVDLPVYDVYTMGCWFYSALVRTRPAAWGPINGEGPVA